MKKIVILISGRGSNMEALLNAHLPVTISAVISNVPDAHGLATAQSHGVATAVVAHRDYTDRAAFDTALAAEIDRHQPDLVVLAGFMRVLTEDFVMRYWGRMVNIHPSLLPAFTGLHTHQRALDAGVRVHGCTIHFVTPGLDSGPIIAQAAVPVLTEDTEDTLAARVLVQEHRLYPQAVRWLCEGRVQLAANGKVNFAQVSTNSGVVISPALDVAPTNKA